jgi:hypothetical protein
MCCQGIITIFCGRGSSFGPGASLDESYYSLNICLRKILVLGGSGFPVHGPEVANQISKVNGKSIFIPSAEYCAKYWTSDMSDYSNLSDILYVSPSGYEKTYDERKKGLLIRPVLP